MNDTLVISPSGKLYGSERVLLDYVTNTSLKFDIIIPSGSDLEEVLLDTSTRHKIITYNPARTAFLYLKLFYSFFIGRYKKLYLNEAGHIKYILLLAKIFPKCLFTVHIRILEDISPERWKLAKKNIPENIKLITISEYISKRFPFRNQIICDPFTFNIYNSRPTYDKKQPLNIGIIGRVAHSKGIHLLPYLLEQVDKEYMSGKIIFHLFGDISEDLDHQVKASLSNRKNVILYGYVKDHSSIYDNLNAVMHLSGTEPLGRIFFESVNRGLPFIGIKAGGIGETAAIYNYNELMVDYADANIMAVALINKLTLLIKDHSKYVNSIDEMKKKMMESMTVSIYCSRVDRIVSGGE
ncbi:glycosyltransferase [Niastella populi]|uniref:Glycosyl transferase family 1 domain-containing protein n=1 Tax=Niastella populi TaxID=550983 RepID=A0A1V9GAG9_9BACT|nr:glycosyltransferase [Niastella populi]OQP67659.1 hypothetical protein A4R26_33005 [Niastella populi]